MRLLTPAAFRAEAVPAMLAVFRAVLPTPDQYWRRDFARPFQPAVTQRGLLACGGPFPLAHFTALAQAAYSVGDEGLYLYVSEMGVSDAALTTAPPRYCPLATAAEVAACVAFYREHDAPEHITLANAVFSAGGRWGAWTTDGWGAPVGGQPPFVEAVYAQLATTEEQEVAAFFEGYEAGLWLTDHRAGRQPERCPWVPGLLMHLFGEQKAAAYIAAAEQRGRR